ncbi:hypothetical protein NFI96_003078 [Prochilodus magdalenae]|nr:hypothetical protein NFI96_003078 [Prochilodus magdalenae]
MCLDSPFLNVELLKKLHLLSDLHSVEVSLTVEKEGWTDTSVEVLRSEAGVDLDVLLSLRASDFTGLPFLRHSGVHRLKVEADDVLTKEEQIYLLFNAKRKCERAIKSRHKVPEPSSTMPPSQSFDSPEGSSLPPSLPPSLLLCSVTLV